MPADHNRQVFGLIFWDENTRKLPNANGSQTIDPFVQPTIFFGSKNFM